MAIRKTELSVSIPSSKCKVCIMKAVTKLLGIDQVTVDAEKGKVTVIGTADPVLVVKAVRKAAGAVRIDTIGEHKDKPAPEPEKPKPAPEPEKPKPTPDPCKDKCPPVVVTFVGYDDAPGYCIIL